MYRNSSVMSVLGTLALLGGCQPAAETAEQAEQRMSGEAAAAKTAIEASNAQFVAHFNAGHSDSVAALYTENAQAMPPNMPAATGRPGIAGLIAGFGAMKPTLALTTGSVVANGPVAVEIGTYRLDFTPPGAPASMTDTGKYMVCWHKVGDKWMMAADIWNSDLPATPPPAPEGGR